MSSILENKLLTQQTGKDFLIPFSSQGLILGLAGTALTVPVICIILKSSIKKLHSDLVMSCILCANNLVISISLFFTSIFILCGYNTIVYNDYICDIQYMTLPLPLLINSYIIGLISAERCLLVVFNIKLSNLIYLAATITLFAIPFTFAIRGIIMGHSLVSITGVYAIASPAMSTKIPILAVYTGLGLISMATVIVSYLSILIFRISHLNRNRQNLNISKEEVFKQKLRITVKSVLILFIFIFNHSGKLWILICDVILKLPRTLLLDAVTVNLLIYSVVTDVTLLLVMNNDIRQKFLKFIRFRNI